MLYCIPRILTKHIVNKNANYKMLAVFDQNTVKHHFEFVIPYIESKIFIPPNTSITCLRIKGAVHRYYLC